MRNTRNQTIVIKNSYVKKELNFDRATNSLEIFNRDEEYGIFKSIVSMNFENCLQYNIFKCGASRNIKGTMFIIFATSTRNSIMTIW